VILVRECVSWISQVILQVEVADRLIWKLHSSQQYIVKSAYNNLIAAENVHNEGFNYVLWIKAIPLKVNIFIWRLFSNLLATNDNLCRRYILEYAHSFCSEACGVVEDLGHLFFTLDYYGRLWLLISRWLGISTAFLGNILDHSIQFRGW
jgi:hypothetical protein